MHLFSRKTPSVAHFEPPDEAQIRKRDFIWRALVFVVLELAFLILTTLCWKNPIPLLPSSVPSRSLTEAKAITTAIAVTWHTIALFPVKGILSTSFSAECIAQYRRTGRFQPNVTDRVSCITSGLLAQVSHFLTRRPTLEYRLGFLLVLSIMAVVPLGPSVIGLNLTWVTHNEDLRIANLTMTKGFLSTPQRQCIEKADEIVNLEFVEGGVYGYETQTNGTLIPWPEPGFEESQKIIKYESDVAVYNYTCRWPGFTFKSHAVITEGNNVSWSPKNIAEFVYGFDMIYPLSNSQDNPLPLSAFIFVYLNPKTHDPLGTVKTWVRVPNEDMAGYNVVTDSPAGMMAAVLLCDPQYTIQRAEVTLQDGKLNATLAEAPLLGNFPESAANSLFSQAVIDAFAPREDQTNSPATTSAVTMDSNGNQTLLTLPEINQNMNEVFRSAAKAYISGYTGFDQTRLGIFPNYTSFDQTVATQDQQFSLVSSRPFLVALWVLYTVIVLILAILVCTTNAREMWLFSLQTMGTIYRGLSTRDDNFPLPQEQHPSLQANNLGFTWRVIAFAILEINFLAFAGYCWTNPILVFLPSSISTSQAKSATTAIVVVWHTLAVFPIKDIISSVFSAECIAQYRRTGCLEPNSTDRVSQATSGLMDQISHFFKGQPTLDYRLAFVLVVLVALIGPLGPGVVALTELPTIRHQDLLVANISMGRVGSVGSTLNQIDLRAKTFVELELLEGRVFGYDTVAEGVLIPWLQTGFEQSENVTTYGSDVVVYNYSCYWATAEVDQYRANIMTPSALPNDVMWTPVYSGIIADTEGIFPLTVFNTNISLTGILFSGNSTLVDLGSTGTSFRIAPKAPSEIVMSSSVLLCDPQYKIQRANVTLSHGNLSADVLPTLPLLGNFPDAAASALFSQALLGALGPETEDPARLLSSIPMLLFTGEFNGTGPLHPFPLPEINANMNRVLKSAAKAYLSGYNFTNPSMLPSYTLWNQTATVQFQQIAFVGSRPFFIVLLALVAMTVTVLMVLLKVIDIRKVQLFNLQTLEKVYTEEIFVRDE